MKYRDKCLKELQKSNDLYCPYCLKINSSGVCCNDYKFVEFNKLTPNDQDLLVQEMVDEYESYAQRRLF